MIKNERHDSLPKRKKILKLGYFISISLVFLFLLKPAITQLIPLRNLSSVDSEIRLVVKQKRNRLFSLKYQDQLPYKIVINGKEETYSYFKCYELNEEKNNITLKFNTQVKSCESMFESSNDILEIDLSDFDMTQVTSMENIFKESNDLEYVNFTNINLPKVENFSYMLILKN